jgi:hypothetical protein
MACLRCWCICAVLYTVSLRTCKFTSRTSRSPVGNGHLMPCDLYCDCPVLCCSTPPPSAVWTSQRWQKPSTQQWGKLALQRRHQPSDPPAMAAMDARPLPPSAQSSQRTRSATGSQSHAIPTKPFEHALQHRCHASPSLAVCLLIVLLCLRLPPLISGP